MADVKENGHHQGNGDNNSVAGEAEGEESNDSGPGLAGMILSNVERWGGGVILNFFLVLIYTTNVSINSKHLVRIKTLLLVCFNAGFYQCRHLYLREMNN